MNPKLTITVDGKNRATAVMEGVVSVGAKVDVVLKGLTSDIPLWGDDDGFVGYSLRFRIVDECGHDLVRYPLEELDQWNSTSTGVYESATAVDFDTDALRHIFEGVVFNDSLEFGVVLDSVVDAAEYGTGRLKIQQWAVASTEDPTVLPDWRETLAKLQEDLENIETAQSAAELARDEAVSAASSAAASATVSASSATAAETAQNSARASELNAAESEAEAGNAADAAEAARDAAEIAEASAISAAASAVGSATSAAESAKEAAESAIAAGKVKSVNGKIGEVVLVASDVGAYSKTETNSKLAAKADLVDGVVPASQLPSYVDDVLEFASVAAFPSTGESGKIYVATDTNLTYRWGGSQYVEISQSLALGETALTAYAGDKGKKVTDDLAAHKTDTENPHAVTAAQVGAYTKAEVDEKATSAAKAVEEAYRKKTDLAVYDDTSTGGKYLYFEFEGGEQIRLYKWDESTAQSLYNEAYGYMSEASESLGGKQMVVWWLKENYADIDTEPDVYANVELMADGDISGATIIGMNMLIPSTSIRTFADGTKGKFLVLEKADTLAKKSEVDAVSAKADAAQESADAVASDLTTHTSDKNIHITEKEREIWNCVKVFDSIVAQAYVPLFKTEGDGTTGLTIKPNVRATLYWDVASLKAKYLYSDEGLQVGSASLKSTLTPGSLDVNVASGTTWITLFAESGKAQLYMLKRAILTLGAENEGEGEASYITSGNGKTTFALKDGTKGSVITPDGSAVVTENTLKTKAPVTSVNGSTGAVTLEATDLGALPATQTGVQYNINSDVEFAGGVYVNGGLYKRGASDDPYLPKTELDSTYATKSALEALAATVGEANSLLESVA